MEVLTVIKQVVSRDFTLSILGIEEEPIKVLIDNHKTKSSSVIVNFNTLKELVNSVEVQP